jgi:hypothetical protein
LPEDLRFIYRVSKAEVYRSIWRVVDAINHALPVEFPLDDPVKLDMLERGFRSKSRVEGWTGQVGSVDGCHFAMTSPGKSADNPITYYVARKSKFAMLVTAVCDSERRFTFWDFNTTPTTHDSQAWGLTKLGQDIAAGKLPSTYFVNGDSAYISSDQMVVPYGKTQNTDFDFVQSSNRMCIECAFGILIRRWGILWRPLEVDFHRRAGLIGCCMRLHNLCIDSRISEAHLADMDGQLAMAVPPDEGLGARWERTPTFKDGRPVEQLDWNTAPAAGSAGVSSARERLREAVEVAGFRRPDPAHSVGRR